MSYSSPQSFTTANGKIIAAVDMVTITTGVKPNSNFIRCCKPPTLPTTHTHTQQARTQTDRETDRQRGEGGERERERERNAHAKT